MKRFLNHFTRYLLVITMLFSICIPSQAEELTPYWVNVNSITTSLQFDGTTAACSLSVSGKQGTTKIAGELKFIDAANGNTLVTFIINSSNRTYDITHYVGGCTKGHSYRVTFTGEVTTNGKKEIITCSSFTKTC